MSRIISVAPVLPGHRYDQSEVTRLFRALVSGPDEALLPPARAALLERLHANTGVTTRHLALPVEDYPGLDGFTGANDAFLRVGAELGEEAVRTALERVGLTGADVDVILSTSVTGIGAPSLDARLVGPLGMRPDVKRIPVFGLGCVAGVAGIARLHDHLVGHPDDVAVLLSVELCSLTVQRDDTSTANLVASGLFGDGATAVVLVGERRAAALGLPGPEVVATRSRFYPDTSGVMGWDIGGTGFKIVLSASVADVVREHLALDVKGFLAGEGLDRSDVGAWLAHPGGPKVLDAVSEALELPEGALHRSWAALAATGNLSSSSVLHVLDRALADGAFTAPPTGGPDGAGADVAGADGAGAEGAPGAGTAVMLAMGPGFCAELALLRWADAA